MSENQKLSEKAKRLWLYWCESVFLMQMWSDHVNRQAVETGAAAKPSRFIKMARPHPVTER